MCLSHSPLLFLLKMCFETQFIAWYIIKWHQCLNHNHLDEQKSSINMKLGWKMFWLLLDSCSSVNCHGYFVPDFTSKYGRFAYQQWVYYEIHGERIELLVVSMQQWRSSNVIAFEICIVCDTWSCLSGATSLIWHLLVSAVIDSGLMLEVATFCNGIKWLALYILCTLL